MKKRKLFLVLGLSFGVAFVADLNKSNHANPVKAATAKTFYLDCTQHDWDSNDSICLHLWGNSTGDKYYEAIRDGDNYWHVDVPDIDGFAGAEFYKCNYVDGSHNWADNLYWKQSWLSFPSDNFYYTVLTDEWGNDGDNWSAPVSWSLIGSSNAALSSYKFDGDGFQYYATSVALSENDVIQFTNGNKTTGFADLRDANNGQTAKEKGLVEDDGTGKVKVVKTGSYDIYVNCVTGKVWMQSDAATDADLWAQEFVAEDCTDGTNGTKAKWGAFESTYNGLTEGAKNLLKGEDHVEYNAVVSGNIKLAVQRYDYVLQKYHINDANNDQYGYKDFMGRVAAGKISLAPRVFPMSIGEEISDSSTMVTLLVTIALLSVATGYLVIIRRRNNQLNK